MTVGQQLHQARTARKLSFGDVTATTKIQPWVLEALEADRLTELMSPVYVKGFLGSYAKFLKMEPAPLLAELRWPQPAESVEAVVAVVVVAAPAPAVEQPAARSAPQRTAQPVMEPPTVSEPVRWERPAPVHQEAVPPPAPRRRPQSAKQPVRVKFPTFQLPAVRLPQVRLPRFTMPRVSMPAIRLPRVQLPTIPWMVWQRAAQAAALTIVIVAVGSTHPVARLKKLPWPTLAKTEKGVSEGKSQASANNEKKALAKKSESAVKVASKPAEKPAEAVKEKSAAKLAAANVAPIGGDVLKPPAPIVPAPVAPAPLELALTANRTTWIKISADGKLVTQQRLGRGANERWTAKKQFEVVISKPSQVEVSLNGQSINAFAVAHKGKLLISHRGIIPLPEPRD